MTLARPPIRIGAYNPQIGGSLIGSGPVTITGTISGQAPALSGVEGQPLPVSYVPNDFERVKGEKVYETKARGKAAPLKAPGNACPEQGTSRRVLLVVTDLKLGQEEGTHRPGSGQAPDDTTDYYLPETVAANDYYPEACPERSRRGMPMVGRTWQAGTYRYGFNGKEADGEWNGEGNAYDFGARVYDGRLGRWMSVDPRSESYPSMGPFVGFASNPQFFVDPGGDTIRVHARHREGSAEYNRLNALINNLELFDPELFNVLQSSKVNISLTEAPLPDKTLGLSNIVIYARGDIEVLPVFDPSGNAIGGRIIDLRLDNRGEKIENQFSIHEDQVIVKIDFEKIRESSRRKDKALDVPEGTSFSREYTKTGVHEVFGHTAFAIENPKQQYILSKIRIWMQKTAKGIGHEVGNPDGIRVDAMEEKFDSSFPNLSRHESYIKIEE